MNVLSGICTWCGYKAKEIDLSTKERKTL